MRAPLVVRAGVFRRDVFDLAAESVDLDGLHPHELRHTGGLASHRFTGPSIGGYRVTCLRRRNP